VNAREEIREPARTVPVRHEADVLVVGGGAAGVAAAVAAGRRGARVVLAERTGALGGLASGGLIVLLLSLDDGRGRQVVGGLCQEVVDRLDALGAAVHPPPREWGSADSARVEAWRRYGLVWGRAPQVVRYAVAYEPEALRVVLAGLLQEAGVRVLHHVLACGVAREGGRVSAVIFESKAGRFGVRAGAVVDATGDGDVFTAAGCAHEHEEVLPWLWFLVGGVEDADAAAAAGAGFRTPDPGRLLLPWGATPKQHRRIDPTSPEDLGEAELACRARVFEAFRELRQRPGFARAHLCRVAEQLGITESRRLLGRHVLAREEMDRPRDDAVALTGHWTRAGALYWIPFDSLLPRELSNLLVAGRCISVDHRVHHATKEIPACFATGQAAGTAAALAVAGGIEPATLAVPSLREALRADGAILDPPDATGPAQGRME